MTPAPRDASMYWFRLPDNEAALMSMRPAELKCYLVVTRAIQRDRNVGMISASQVAKRADVTRQHAQRALDGLVKAGHLRREGRPGATPIFSLPVEFVGVTNLQPTGDRLPGSNAQRTGGRSDSNLQRQGDRLDQHGDHNPQPTGDRNLPPTGGTHLEILESEREHTFGNIISGDDVATDFAREVLNALRARAGTPSRLSDADRRLCREWEHSGIPIVAVQRAIELGCLRHYVSAINRGMAWGKISSLRYFANVLVEAQDPETSDGYWANVTRRLKRVEAERTPDYATEACRPELESERTTAEKQFADAAMRAKGQVA